MTQPASPVHGAERYEAIDFLRGLAVCGILVMNIQLFAMPSAAYMNPTALDDRGVLDFSVWLFGHLFFDQKFMTIFSMLFGAGVVIMTMRAEQRGVPTAALHYRRMLALLIFGLIHAYVIWDGDILFLYAVCGSLVYPMRRWRPRTLLLVGLAALLVGSSILVSGGLFLPLGPPEAAQEFRDFWAPSDGMIANEIAAMRGSWLAQMSVRGPHAFDFQTTYLLLWGLWRAAGNMLIGMALFKWGITNGQRPVSFYARLAALGFLAGLPVIALGVWRMNAHQWEAIYSFFHGALFNYWASEIVACGWIGVAMLIWKSGAGRALVSRFVAVGRTAFSCYILTSVICSLIFFGHGLGFYASWSRLAQHGVTLGVWITLLIVPPLWLTRFRFGPLEWVWRTVTYGTVQPLRLARHSSRDWPQRSITES